MPRVISACRTGGGVITTPAMTHFPSPPQIGFLGLVLFVANIGQCLAACPPVLILERSMNRNRVHYEANPKSSAEPITARWEMIEKGPGKWEELTTLERSRAYGVKTPKTQGATPLRFSIAGVPSKTFTLLSDKVSGCPIAVFTADDGTEIAVSKVQLTMKRSLVPAVEKVQFVGVSVKDGRPLRVDVKI